MVEKLLTNWLSLCMYPHLKSRVNNSLFMLYKAIKHQTEKGPVDAVTAEARYSLSEDRLLREKTESRTLVSSLFKLSKTSSLHPEKNHYYVATLISQITGLPHPSVCPCVIRAANP